MSHKNKYLIVYEYGFRIELYRDSELTVLLVLVEGIVVDFSPFLTSFYYMICTFYTFFIIYFYIGFLGDSGILMYHLPFLVSLLAVYNGFVGTFLFFLCQFSLIFS